MTMSIPLPELLRQVDFDRGIKDRAPLDWLITCDQASSDLIPRLAINYALRFVPSIAPKEGTYGWGKPIGNAAAKTTQQDAPHDSTAACVRTRIDT